MESFEAKEAILSLSLQRFEISIRAVDGERLSTISLMSPVPKAISLKGLQKLSLMREK